MPFLGGYVDTDTGIKYLNATTQTLHSSQQEVKESATASKQTQTVETVQKSQQIPRDVFTQTESKDIYSIADCVSVITPRKPYLSADILEEVKLKSVLTIQSGLRKWLAEHQLKVIKEEICQHANWEKIRNEKRAQEAKELERNEELCIICPRARKDIDLLFNCLQKWSDKELERINKTTWGPERLAALNIHTEKHVKHIGEIHTKKIAALQNMKLHNKLAFLNKAAAAKKWKTLNVETSGTLRARELRDLYCTLTLPNLETAECIDALLSVVQIVKEHECELSNEIISLADREMHLLERRIKQANLHALHQRIITLFWEYISQPAFNPAASKKVDIAYLVEKIWKCRSPISGSTCLKDLVLTRWNKYNECLPWNAVLLTHTEADGHDNLNSVEEAYEPEFITGIKRCLSAAYAHFTSLPRILPYMNRDFLQKVSLQTSGNKNLISNSVDGEDYESAIVTSLGGKAKESVEDEQENFEV